MSKQHKLFEDKEIPAIKIEYKKPFFIKVMVPSAIPGITKLYIQDSEGRLFWRQTHSVDSYIKKHEIEQTTTS